MHARTSMRAFRWATKQIDDSARVRGEQIARLTEDERLVFGHELVEDVEHSFGDAHREVAVQEVVPTRTAAAVRC